LKFRVDDPLVVSEVESIALFLFANSRGFDLVLDFTSSVPVFAPPPPLQVLCLLCFTAAIIVLQLPVPCGKLDAGVFDPLRESDMRDEPTNRHPLFEPHSGPAEEKSIATLSRLEFTATRLFKRGKHFLIATRMCVSSASRFRVPGGNSCSTVVPIRIAEAAKINRNIELIEPPRKLFKTKGGPPNQSQHFPALLHPISRFPFSIFRLRQC
jgi:hypothetical protein